MRTAAYARYSSDQQRDASLEDQLRNCRAYCERMGWAPPAVYQDAAISGSRNDRPGYLQLLADAGRFDVIVVDDLSRLSRDSIESAQAIRRLTFRGIRLVSVGDGLDTARKDAKVNASLRGLMGELYLDDLRDKTHRGLTGRALAGASAGGLPYGYRVTETGQRAVREDQAEVVRRIAGEYLAGQSPRQIALALNAEAVPSPRGGTWVASAIYGDARRGIGILANPIYAGRQVWNRSRWVKHPDTGRRVRQERPAAEWVTVDKPELAILPAATWEAVQARLKGRHRNTASQGGRPPRHLLSGLLRCGECGGPMVVVDRYRYGCATAKERGTCPSRVRFARIPAEASMLAAVREELQSPEAFKAFQASVTAGMKRKGPSVEQAQRELAEAERVQQNIMAAIKAGILTPSTRSELIAAEACVEAARSAVATLRQREPAAMMPRAREVWAGLLSALEKARSVSAKRDALEHVLGGSAIVKTENGAVFAEAPSQIAMVAGAGFGPYLTGPARIYLSRG